MNVEDLKYGDLVGFSIEPGCPGEIDAHGIAPIVNRQHRIGRFLGFDKRSPRRDHPYRVEFTTPRPVNGKTTWWGWFSAEELVDPEVKP